MEQGGGGEPFSPEMSPWPAGRDLWPYSQCIITFFAYDLIKHWFMKALLWLQRFCRRSVLVNEISPDWLIKFRFLPGRRGGTEEGCSAPAGRRLWTGSPSPEKAWRRSALELPLFRGGRHGCFSLVWVISAGWISSSWGWAEVRSQPAMWTLSPPTHAGLSRSAAFWFWISVRSLGF